MQDELANEFMRKIANKSSINFAKNTRGIIKKQFLKTKNDIIFEQQNSFNNNTCIKQQIEKLKE